MFIGREQKIWGLIFILGAMLFLGVDKYYLRQNGAWITVSLPFLMDDFFQSLMNPSSVLKPWHFLVNNAFFAWVFSHPSNHSFDSRETLLMKKGEDEERQGAIRMEPFFHIPPFLLSETESRWPLTLWGLFQRSWKS